MPKGSFTVGKVPPETLNRTVYTHTGKPNRRLLLGPGIGRDVAAVGADPILILTTDPVTGTSTRIGEHSVYVNANDIATAGAKAVWYLCTILLPPGSTEKTLGELMKGIDGASRKLGITVARGHTEVTRGLDRPVIVGFMIGEKQGRILRARDARVGDMILLTKSAGIEGTAILASDYADRLKRVPAKLLRRARLFSREISVAKEALVLSKIPGVRVLHDPTEGGVLNACWELGEAARLGIEVWADKIPVSEETETICSRLRLNPLKLMSSGCLLAIVAPKAVDRAVRLLGKARVSASVIGIMTTRANGRKYTLKGKRSELMPVPSDELYKLA
ncbi:MAG TPA: AIR synthase family protein [Candidatus Dormibacteraeota bacterium]|nr:AIR synthase family protein [Candidatus Dormibacteraeota bacterium]